MHNYLTEPQRIFVDNLYDAIYEGKDVVKVPRDVSVALSDEEIWWLLDFVWNEYPELCAYNKAATRPWGGDDADAGRWLTNEIHIAYRDDIDIDEQKYFIDVMSESTAQFRGMAPADGIRAIYDYVIERFTYDHTWSDSWDTQFAYYSWTSNVALCNGYAQTIALMCHFAGYGCSYVDGHVDATPGAGGHAWNVFEADGRLFYGDATWDDQLGYAHYYAMPLYDFDDDHLADSEYPVLMR